MLKENYTVAEWQQKEEHYMKELANVILPEQPTTADVLEVTSKLDSIYTEASFDYAFVKRKESKINLDLKNAETEMFGIIKKQQLSAGASKITESDVKSLVKNYLATNPLTGYKADIYTTSKAIITRVVFMEQVIKTIAAKSDGLKIAASMLKIEGGFSGAKDNAYSH